MFECYSQQKTIPTFYDYKSLGSVKLTTTSSFSSESIPQQIACYTRMSASY
ncbi:hypothetical protein J6590_090727 [Homalodisca vitripennis]|nr:hypothetical protein J6590_090727 [Homalodisca vitripennis]